ncbi:MAG: zf-HC2 domain-containing protein [Lachnospiraceae bacterium]|nr:zf-HC2 domain-containing protein [Lachnospiraceae bacterium]
MDCKEAQRCIHLFLKDELDVDTAFRFVEHVSSCNECMEELTVEYLLREGINRLENAEDIDVQSELEDRLNRAITRKRVQKQLKAGLFLVGSLIFFILLLGGV